MPGLQMWDAFREATGVTAPLTASFAFGDSPAMADELAALVRHGPKRATAGLLVDYERGDEKIPEVGDYWVVLDGRGEAVCVIRNTEVVTKPFREVDAAFAWDEGEGDRSLAYWREGHERYFRRRCDELGVPFSEELPVVFERFELVWPETGA